MRGRHPDKGLSAVSGLLGCAIMLRIFIALALLAFSVTAAERRFEFTADKENETPKGFRSVLTGEGNDLGLGIRLRGEDAPNAATRA